MLHGIVLIGNDLKLVIVGNGATELVPSLVRQVVCDVDDTFCPITTEVKRRAARNGLDSAMMMGLAAAQTNYETTRVFYCRWCRGNIIWTRRPCVLHIS